MIEKNTNSKDDAGFTRTIFVWGLERIMLDHWKNMEHWWKKWTEEYKYRWDGKTLCCLYAKRNCIGFMIIFGKDERLKLWKHKRYFLWFHMQKIWWSKNISWWKMDNLWANKYNFIYWFCKTVGNKKKA